MADFVEILTGWKLNANRPLSADFLKSKGDMLTDIYGYDGKFTICTSAGDDYGKLFIYNSSKTASAETGNYHIYEGQVIEFSVMPNATEALLNSKLIVIYTGDTTASYTKGMMYYVVSDGATPPVYSWESVLKIDTDELYTTDHSHLASSKLIAAEIEKSKKGFKFVGYLSTAEPTGATLKTGQLWYMSNTMPTVFPIQCHTYDGSAWSATTSEYTPDVLDLWSNLEDHHGYYWFGTQWNMIDFNYGADGVTIEINASEQFAVKDGGLTVPKFKDDALNKKGSALSDDDEHLATSGLVKEVTDKRIPQLATLPTASADTVGQVVQYVGATTTTAPIYTHDFFYECKEDTSVSPSAYSWDNVNVQTASAWGSITGTLADQTDLQTVLDEKAKATSIAPLYSNTSTYAVGDVCMHDCKRYKCNTAIATAEEWTVAHWTEENVDTAYVKKTGDVMTGDLDLSKHQIKQAAFENLVSAPASPILGQHYFNTTDNSEYVWNGTEWKANSVKIPVIDSGDVLPTTGIQTDCFYKCTYVEGYTLIRYDLTAAAEAGGYTMSSLGLNTPDGFVPWTNVASDWYSYAMLFEEKADGLLRKYTNITTAAIILKYNSSLAATGWRLYVYHNSSWVVIYDSAIDMSQFITQTTADGRYLQLSGGTLAGAVIQTLSIGTPILKSDADNKGTFLCGGSTSSNGASLNLTGKAASQNGAFYLTAQNSSFSTSLIGYPGGDLIWGGLALLTANKLNSVGTGWGQYLTITGNYNFNGHNGFIIDSGGVYPLICWSANPAISGTSNYTIVTFTYGSTSSIQIKCVGGNNQWTIVMF